MDGIFDLLSGFGWHEAIVLCIVVTTIYFVVMVLRFLQLPRRDVYRDGDTRAPEMRSPPPEYGAPPGSAFASIWAEPNEPRLDEFWEPRRAEPQFVPQPEPEPTFTPSPSFVAHLEQQIAKNNVEGDVRQLRDYLAESRDEIQRLKAEVDRLSAVQRVSPLYNEAMGLAVRGVDAAGIAGRCGISIAEAELVVALSRRPDDRHEGGETHGRE